MWISEGEVLNYYHAMLDETFPVRVVSVTTRGVVIELPTNDGQTIRADGKGVMRRTLTHRQANGCLS